MRRACALIAAACLVAPSPAAAQVLRSIPVVPSAPSTPLVLPSAAHSPISLPSASGAFVPLVSPVFSVPSVVPSAKAVAVSAASAFAVPSVAKAVSPVTALSASFIPGAKPADSAPMLSRVFDGSVARSAASEAPVPSDGATPAPSALKPASRPEAVVKDSLVRAPSPLRRRLAQAGAWTRAASVLAPVLALIPTVTAAMGTDAANWLGLTGFAVGAAAVWPAIPEALKARSNSTAIGAAVIGGVVLGGAIAALSGWSLIAGVAAAVAIAAAGAYSSSVVRAFFSPARGEKALLGVETRGERRLLWVEPARFGELMLLVANFEKGLGEKDLHAAKADSYERAVYFKRTGDFVELVARDLSRRAASGTPLAKALSEVSADATIGKAKIVEENPITGAVALDLKAFALQDFFSIKSELEGAFDANYALDEDLSALTLAAGHPSNLEIGARQVFTRKAAPADGEPATRLADARRLTLSLRLSLSALPESGYVPRTADSRLGHFATVYEDWADDRADLPTRALVNRWRLEKSDPNAAVSPVKKPVVFWLDASVPERYRESVKKGVLAWNEAFARAGLLGALEVKDAPEGFDSSDARHTVIRWFMDKDSGYAIGQTRVDPVTGEIYQATLGISAIHPRSASGVHFVDLGDGSEAEEKNKPHKHGPNCRHGEALSRQAQMTLAVVDARGGMSEAARERFIQDYIVDLTLHEVGHTLGLRHNFLGKTWKDASELSGEAPLGASVMDYMPANIAPPGAKQGSYWNTKLGPYDFWAIEYAYKPLSAGEEKTELARIAARADEPGLAYATDEDIVGLDPDSEPWYLGRDPLEWARGRMAVVRELWKSLETRPVAVGADHSATYRAFVQGWRGYLDAARLTASIVGGLGYRRNSGSSAPYTPISGARRRAALALIEEVVFSDAPFDASSDLRRRLDPGRAPTVDDQWPELGWVAYDELTLWLRQDALSRLLDPELMALLSESVKMAPAGDNPLAPRELIETLTQAVWREVLDPIRARKASVSPSRRRLQEAHLNLLILLAYRSAEDEVPEVSAIARAHLARLSEKLADKSERKAWDEATRDHLTQSVNKIDSAESRYEP